MLRHLKEKREESGDQGRLTTVRREVKYLLKPEEAKTALQALSARIPLKVYEGAKSSYRISVYLDCPDRALAHAELKALGRSSIKLRAKDYYVVERTKPVFEPTCFVEVKARLGTIVEKSRLKIERQQLPLVLARGPSTVAGVDDRAAVEAFEDVRAGRVLSPLFVVHYHRTTLEDRVLNMRITFDDHISYHVPPHNLYTDTFACSRAELPPPLHVEQQWIVEMKTVGTLPEWVLKILKPEQRRDYSKFGTGVRELARRGLLEPA